MVDLHTHPLPGLDDGVTTPQAALELLRAAANAGVTVLAATPHVSERYPTGVETMHAAVDALSAAAAGLPLELAPGAEVALSYLNRLSDDEIYSFTLGGSGRYLLVELPPSGWALGIELAFERLRALGVQPVIAHPERHPLVRERSDRLTPLLEEGALLQVTIRSLRRGNRDSHSAATARELLRRGMVHILASDTHGVDPESPSPWEVDLPDRELEELCVRNPNAIVHGDEVATRRLRRPLLARVRRR